MARQAGKGGAPLSLQNLHRAGVLAMFQQPVQACVREIIRDEHEAAGKAPVELQPRLHLPVARPDDDAGPVFIPDNFADARQFKIKFREVLSAAPVTPVCM